MKYREKIAGIIAPELVDELRRVKALAGSASFSLAVERRNGKRVREELAALKKVNVQLTKQNREYSRKLSRLGIK